MKRKTPKKAQKVHKIVLEYWTQAKEVKRLSVAVTAFMSLFADDETLLGRRVIGCLDILRGKQDDEIFGDE